MVLKILRGIVCVATVCVVLGTMAVAIGADQPVANNVVSASKNTQPSDTQQQHPSAHEGNNGTVPAAAEVVPCGSATDGGGGAEPQSRRPVAARSKLNNGTCVSAFCAATDADPGDDDVDDDADHRNTSATGRGVDVINGTAPLRRQQHQKRRMHQQLHRNVARAHLQQTAAEDIDDDPFVYGSKKVVLKADVLRHTSVLYGLLSIADRDGLSERCYRELQRVYDGIQQKEIWAMKDKLEKAHLRVSADLAPSSDSWHAEERVQG
ncbi:AGAP007659-PB-like protein [Anopheles sinensis]|uniref:AGAP007659-PB-like protein n=1 Tax=Anopheles sinensis TaxID=74873 RepID=A0A084VF89_ANOSI|nr:AGAP007659-PB-like protein [Anopheles sinensis]